VPDSRPRLQAAAALLAAAALAVTGCAVHTASGKLGKKVVLDRGLSAQGRPWRLTASEQGGQLGLFLESPSGYDYSGGIGFRPGPPPGLWLEGSGPHGSIFYYGPAPTAAVTVRLSSPGRAAIRLPTRPFPRRAGLPPGRYFITQPPGSINLDWNVTLLDAAGRKVAFADF
jgi:hypothetical protein